MTDVTDHDVTYAGTTVTNSSANKTVVKKKAAKPKMSAKEKKERSVSLRFAFFPQSSGLTVHARLLSRKPSRVSHLSSVVAILYVLS
jgi:hypothetical protein